MMDNAVKDEIITMAKCGFPLTEISKRTGAKYASVYYHAAKSRLYQPKRNIKSRRLNDYSPQLQGRSLAAIEGTLLSDAGLFALTQNCNALYRISLSGEEHSDWLDVIEAILTSAGVVVMRSCKERDNVRGRYMHNMLWTRVHPELTTLYKRWYAGGIKEVPSDFILTPLSLANWFMGDGCSSWCPGDRVSVYFSSQNFSRRSTDYLKGALARLGINQVNDHKPSRGCGPGVELAITSMDNIASLMTIVEPLIVPSYRYKVKYPRLRRSKCQ